MKTSIKSRHKIRIVTQRQEVQRAIRSSPRLSVILCTFNRRDLVLSTLASLRRQTLPFDLFEVIVVDNGSSDGTLGTEQAYVQAGFHHGKKPQEVWQVQCLSEAQNGLAHARRTGIMAASGEIAVFLDDDTIADMRFLERLLAAYDETDADAVGGHVELRWEASRPRPRPHWLSEDLLYLVGYYAPSKQRTQLQDDTSFSSCAFSVKMEALRDIGYFSPFLSKRAHLPANLEMYDLCMRLRQAGYALWYEPEAVVIHRVAARLKRAFFVGRAYWQGRSEILLHYLRTLHTSPDAVKYLTWPLLRTIVLELREIAYLALIHRPLLHLAHKPSNETLMAAMEQARYTGRVRQQVQFLEHAPPEITTPALYFVLPAQPEASATLLVQSLIAQDVACVTGTPAIPLAWLWRHRANRGQGMGIIHFCGGGALELTSRQRQALWLRLWLARCLGIRVVITDTGGWWQVTRHIRFLARRMLERNLLRYSDIVLAATRQPEQLYADKSVRRHVRSLPPPGFRGYYADPLPRSEAHSSLGILAGNNFVYLCLASQHTERELLYLMDAFTDLTETPQKQAKGAKAKKPQLVIVGMPHDKKKTTRIVRRAALNADIYLCMVDPTKEDMPLYIGAADAIVQPHFAIPSAGTLDTALLALSFGRVVIAPNLPRFRGMLPPRASVLYEPAKRESLMQALIHAQKLHYRLNEKEMKALDSHDGWNEYTDRVLKIYHQVLK